MIDRVYRAAPPGALRVEPLGELTAIFDRRSMQTHLVVSPMPEILDAMGPEPCSVTNLVSRLATSFDLDNEGDVPFILGERLRELATMGLVERA